MASNLLLNDEVQQWLSLHNVSLDVVPLDPGSSTYLWPQQVSGIPALLTRSADNATATVEKLVTTLQDEGDELWMNDPAPAILSACVAFPDLLSQSALRLPLRDMLLWTIVEGIIPDVGVLYEFDRYNCDCISDNIPATDNASFSLAWTPVMNS